MANKKFTVHCLYLHRGIPWPIDVEVLVAEEKTKGLIEALERALNGLTGTGFVPAIGKTPPKNQPENMTPTAEIPPPHCGVHRMPMIPSKYPRKDGWIGYYCPNKDAGGYCKHQAKVNPANHSDVEFWEKK